MTVTTGEAGKIGSNLIKSLVIRYHHGQVNPSLTRKAGLYPDQEFVVWGSGHQARAFVPIDDVVQGILKTRTHGMNQGSVQLGLNQCMAIRDMARRGVKISGNPIRIRYDLTKPEGDRGRCADYSKTRKILGWEPRVTLSEELTRLFAQTLSEGRRGGLA